MFALLLLTAHLLTPMAAAAAPCPPAGMTRADLVTLKESKFDVPDEAGKALAERADKAATEIMRG